MPKQSQSFKSVLNYPQRLFTIYQHKINQQTQLLALIKSAIPAQLADHALHCVLSGKKILLYTDSAIWSSQLRFYQQTILGQLHEHGYRGIETLQIKVTPQQIADEHPSNVKIPCRKNIELIRQQGMQQSDDRLNRALLRLSETLDRLSTQKD
ncbi:DciA family protein [Methylomarinum sp. Ch1-1]|uniref:DciA family protein n=1 Tax=Methylomarinum roseum TaxID=3067653 RepID=A0AAU7NXN1_9GAMM|nr:DciA family protein [Methylomarinum sp. Ch1-1]MDP4522160.1 DciA family protein [Methylomarinum sp. Ch1-1]